MKIDTSKKLLVLVESPNKTKSVASILKSLGYKNVKVLATVGHTTQIKNVHGSYKNTGIYPNKNFKVTYEIAPDKYKVVENIKAQVAWADLILIASDPDREGENLGNHIKNLLKLKDDQYYRITYHSITKDAIKQAMENPTKMNEDLCNAAEARQVIDKMIGFALSPVAKTYVGAKSVGRCQSIGLKLICDREKEILNFKPETYIDLYLNFIKNNTQFKAKYVGTDEMPIDHLKSKEDVANIKRDCTDQYIIKNITKKLKEESPKPPFCTATYQQEVASKLGLKVKDAMSCAQKLFEGLEINGEHVGLITYMRTDSTDFADDFIPELKAYIENNLGKDMYKSPRKGKKSATAQEGHEALRVVSLEMTPEKLAEFISNDLLLKVYRIIWQRTLASALPNAVISETIYDIYNKQYKFMLKSNELVNPGYRKVYENFEESEDETTLPDIFKKDEILQSTSLEDIEKQTQPKPRYKEASLIKELQKREIGRPSTYATIVETVLSPTRGYCELENKFIVPTEKGMQLAGFLDRAFPNIINYDYTKHLEDDLDLITNGKLKELDFLTNFYNTLEESIKANKESDEQKEGIEEQFCPKCGAPMVVRRSRFGKLFYGCSNYPKCNGIKNIN